MYYKTELSCDNSGKVELTEPEAEKHFNAAVSYIRTNVNWNFTAAMAENILCLLHAEMGIEGAETSMVPRRDLLYFYGHRKDAMNHLYRWKLDINGKAILQVLVIKNTNEVVTSVPMLEVNREGSEKGSPYFGAYWMDEYPHGLRGGVTSSAQYQLGQGYWKHLV